MAAVVGEWSHCVDYRIGMALSAVIFFTASIIGYLIILGGGSCIGDWTNNIIAIIGSLIILVGVTFAMFMQMDFGFTRGHGYTIVLEPIIFAFFMKPGTVVASYNIHYYKEISWNPYAIYVEKNPNTRPEYEGLYDLKRSKASGWEVLRHSKANQKFRWNKEAQRFDPV